ncbi:MAG: 4'-phosphopantetheinyl transferase family protein [Candidatus Dormibacteria bacterium]
MAELAVAPSVQRHLRRCLSQQDLEQALAIPQARIRDRFRARRAWLRWLLAAYIDVEPRSLVFALGTRGKPHLMGTRTLGLQFNVAHSGDLMVLAVANDVNVGVDLEQVQAGFPVGDVAHRFFADTECRLLAGTGELERPSAFFRIWTRKEAYLKGLGLGIDDQGLRHTVVAVGPDRLGGTQTVGWAGHPNWCSRDVAVAVGYVAAVAVPSSDVQVPARAHPISDLWR